MRPIEFELLLNEERERHSLHLSLYTAKNKLTYILFLGIKDQHIVDFVIPKLVSMELARCYSKEGLKDFISGHELIDIAPLPERHALTKDVKQRRMDSFARLLSLRAECTPCVSVALYNGELIISSNAPKGMSNEQLVECLTYKMSLIRDFLMQLTEGVVAGSKPCASLVELAPRAKLLALSAVTKIISEEFGGVGDVIPSPKIGRRKKTPIIYLENALLKLAQFSILGILTNGIHGFTPLELRALLSDTATIVLPNMEALGGMQLHAEQAILYYLREYTAFVSDDSQPVNIGISKLCCQACHEVLSREPVKISHRGSHGMSFPGVYDIDTADLHASTPTRMGASQCPSDSESDCGIIDGENEVPTIASLLAASGAGASRPPRRSSMKSGQLLFKCCNTDADSVDKDLTVADAEAVKPPLST